MTRSQKDVAGALRVEAYGCCDDALTELLYLAANMLDGADCITKGCERPRELGSFCRPCYQAIRRKALKNLDAQNRPRTGD